MCKRYVGNTRKYASNGSFMYINSRCYMNIFYTMENNQSPKVNPLHCKSNDWFLYEKQHWADIG